ncbi:lysophospholipid acyltransferase family protein [Cysteiniphilum sp. 6C5]|uniref:lysophospholipid acyltransferase family protein n=1 Tax=unclassified Cysteiniphilum TaxID=2610889 RepID=UPI003F84D854
MKKIGAQALILILFLWGKLSFKTAQRIGAMIGILLYYCKSDMRRIARINIDKCFPELSDYHKRKLVKKTLQQTCMTGAEMPGILFKNPQKLLKQIQVVHGGDISQRLYEEGRGVMVVAPHLGSYEIASMYYSSKYPSAMLYTPPKIKTLDKLILRARSRLCENMSPANQKGVKMLFKALAKKQVIAMLTDQVPVDAGGTYVDFFGNPAKTMNFAGKLYERYKPAVVLSYAVRNSDGKGLTLFNEDLEPLIKHYQAIDGIEDPVAYAFTKRFEEIIRQYPEQYQWTYKRFKYHPDGIDYYKKDKK